MTKSKHTPGPWNDGIYHAVTNGGRTYAHIHAQGQLVPVAAVPLGVEGYGREEGEANARLIAAAPDLMAALNDALWAIDNMSAILSASGMSTTLDDPRPQMRAAIAKAEGK